MTPSQSGGSARNWTRLDGVDLLRGLAILFVLMNHVNMRLLAARVPYTRGLPPQLVRSLVWNGEFGVQIFFAVSGFLITSTALRRWGTPAAVNLRDFYLLRFARIAPLLLGLLAVLSILHCAHVRHFVVSAKTDGLGQALFAALTLHVNLLEARRGYLPANWDILWSLSVEEIFYIFFPLAFRFLSRIKLLVVALFILVVLGPFARTVLAHGNPVWREYSYLGGMDAIALGCLTALFLARRHLPRPVIRAAGCTGAALMVFVLCLSLQAGRWGLGRVGLDMSILAAGTCMVIAAAAQSRWRSPRILVPLRLLGQRSYEVYLTHMFLVFALFAIFLAAGKPIRAVPLLFLAAIAASGLLGELVAQFYSEPMNRWLRDRFGDGPARLGTAISDSAAKPLV
jgi:peptidoglycan/LPS O-acetylase OafA/YrhL